MRRLLQSPRLRALSPAWIATMNEAQRLLVKASIDQLQSARQQLSDRFYQELFNRAPALTALFRADAASRLTKFNNMLATLANLKHLDAITPAIEALGQRHISYGVEREHYQHARQALLASIAAGLPGAFSAELREAWQAVLDRVIELMTRGYANATEQQLQRLQETDAQLTPGGTVVDTDLLQAIGGEAVVERIHRRFYEVMFEDEWLGRYFWGKSIDALVSKQTRFLVACFGGENHYNGETPAIAHMHMFITAEMADLREHLLRQAILAEGLSPAIADRWLAVEAAFRPAVIKASPAECVMRCVGQQPINHKKPAGYPWPLPTETVEAGQ